MGYVRIDPQTALITEVYFVVSNPWKGMPLGQRIPEVKIKRGERKAYGVSVVGHTYKDFAGIDPDSNEVVFLLIGIYDAIARIRPENQNVIVHSKGKHRVEIRINDDEIVFLAK